MAEIDLSSAEAEVLITTAFVHRQSMFCKALAGDMDESDDQDGQDVVCVVAFLFIEDASCLPDPASIGI